MMPTSPSRRPAAWVAGLILAFAATPGLAQDAPPADAALNPQRARVPLNDVPPALTAPAAPHEQPAPLPERAARGLAHATELRGEQRYTEATLELEKAQRHAPDDPRIAAALALTLWEAGDVQRVQKYVDALAADSLVAHYLRGRLAARRFDNAEALRQYRLALLCPVTNPTREIVPLAQYHLAETLVAEGYLTAAITAYERFDASSQALPDDGVVSAELRGLRTAVPRTAPARIADVAAQLGEFKIAAERFEAAYGDSPMPTPERRRYAEILLGAGATDQALTEARAVVLADPTAIDLLSAVYAQRGTPDGAITDLQKLSTEHPDNAGLAQALATALQRAGRAQEAVSVLRNRAADASADPAVHWALFDTLTAQQDWQAALQAAADAVVAEPATADEAARRVAALPPEACPSAANTPSASDTFAVAFVRGALAQACGADDAAIAQFEQSIAAQAEFVPARVRLGRLQLARFAWDAALAAAAPDGVDLPEDAQLETIIGQAQIGLAQNDEAGEHLRKAIRLDRTNTTAMIALAELYGEQREMHRAMRLLQTLVDTDPNNARGREMLFSAYLTDRDRRAAARQIEELRRMSAPPTTIARCVAWLEFDRDHPDPARFERTLQEAVDASAPDAPTLHLIALAQMQQRRYADAVKTLEQAAALDPAHQETAEALVGAYRANLQFDDALRERRMLIERYPNRDWARDDEIELLRTLQRFDEALTAVHAWLAEDDLDADRADTLRETEIGIDLQREDYPAAIAAMEAQRARHPHDPQHLRRLIVTLQHSGRQDEALELIRHWPQDIPEGFAVSGLPAIWRRMPENQYDEVAQLMLAAVAKNPGSDALQVSLIDLLSAIGDYAGALEVAAANAQVSPYADAYTERRADVLNAAGRIDDAIDLVREILLAQPDDNDRLRYVPYEMRQMLVRLLVKAGRHDQATKEVNRWLAQANENLAKRAAGQSGWPQPGELIGGDLDLERQFYLGLLAFIHQETGDTAESLQTLQLILDQDVDDAGASNDLGYSLADAGQDVDRAEALIRFAVAKQPRNSAFLDSLGWVLYKQGNFEAARLWLTRARYAGEGEDPVVCDHLADACWRAGLTQEAQKWWNESVKLAEESLKDEWPSPLHARTLKSVQAKLQAVSEGTEPQVAPLAQAPDAGD
ncbi:MAG TPA: tetratricopeptide repeat protein [Phycisphaerae bacterium]|nr:tetratricopeptide repeat protein [Phycisphaerae bacterium]